MFEDQNSVLGKAVFEEKPLPISDRDAKLEQLNAQMAEITNRIDTLENSGVDAEAREDIAEINELLGDDELETEAQTVTGAINVLKDALDTHKADNVTDDGGVHGLEIEEGTWTPVLVAIVGTNGTHTYSEQIGSYVKIGKLVYVTCGLTLSSKDTAMVAAYTGIRGLPFPVSAAGTATISKAANIKLPDGGIHLVSTIQSTEFAINVFFDNGATGGLPDTSWNDTSSVRISGVYKTV